jgi:hypothetical protein
VDFAYLFCIYLAGFGEMSMHIPNTQTRAATPPQAACFTATTHPHS